MRKARDYSLCFLFKIFTKKYFLYLLLIFLINGFFVSNINAETINEDITEDTTWTKENSPYLIENSIYINDGITLTINSGVVVKFLSDSNTSLNVFGSLIVNGDENDKVYFTSNNDDTVGGNTNPDIYCYDEFDDENNFLGEICEDFSPDPEITDWRGVYFYNSKNGSVIKNSVFKYANQALGFISSDAEFENLEIHHSSSGLVAYNNSQIKINKANISDVYHDVFVIFNSRSSILNSSSLILNDAIIKDVKRSPISIFNSSSLNISNSSMSNILDGDAISVFNDSSLKADNLNISDVFNNHNQTISLFNHSSLSLNNSHLSDCPYNACVTFFDGFGYINNPSSVNIENSILENGVGSGLLTFSDSVIPTTIKNSILRNFDNATIENYSPATIIHAENNFWGNDTGPFHSVLNNSGTAGSVSNGVEFIPWCREESCNEKNPVILVPGMTGSYLYKNYDDYGEIWPNVNKILLPFGDLYLNDLVLDENGLEKQEYSILVKDIIRGISIPIVGQMHVFDLLIDELKKEGYIEDENLFVFPYDWRKSNLDNATLLKNKIDEIINQTGNNKVDIVAHSMGGLIVKKYIFDNGYEKVDQLVFLGTPQLGASKAFKALMFGDDMGYGISIFSLNPERLKYISQNMPSVYELLPSEKYVGQNNGYVIDAQDANSVYLNYEETKNLMIEKDRNPLMFEFAENLHDNIDNLDLSSIETYNFVGCGTKTIGKIIIQRKKSWKKLFLGWEDDYDLIYVNGDETVPLDSAKETIGANIYFAKSNTHGSLPSADGVRQNIVSILTGQGMKDFENILNDDTPCNISGRVISVHSPVDLHIYDEKGNHTGPDENGEIEHSVKNIQYDILGDVKFAFLPDGFNYKIIIKATDTGGYNFQIINQNKNDEIVNRYNWTLIPLNSLKSQGEIWIGPDYDKDDYILNMDDNGDSIFDNEYKSGFDGTSYAEEVTKTKDIEIKKYSFGSLIINNQTWKESVDSEEIIPVDSLIKLETNIGGVGNSDYQKLREGSSFLIKEIGSNTNDFKELPEDKNNLLASVHTSEARLGIIWVIIALFILLLIILVKKLTIL